MPKFWWKCKFQGIERNKGDVNVNFLWVWYSKPLFNTFWSFLWVLKVIWPQFCQPIVHCMATNKVGKRQFSHSPLILPSAFFIIKFTQTQSYTSKIYVEINKTDWHIQFSHKLTFSVCDICLWHWKCLSVTLPEQKLDHLDLWYFGCVSTLHWKQRIQSDFKLFELFSSQQQLLLFSASQTDTTFTWSFGLDMTG